ncbi:C40 family peptidase [Amycolatopsis viridis]|uniref:Cell wall-associated NlpC family hydrolase n=1 Tax=Amycolatopsis viridis TaxID=185678 RepID=A0ABX0SWZ6_9PSEU|nr:C40 family peptidase [Amycolatopsis viridis]NIH81483.1 cell wall-associated NlpC family hydrolase [Amycolatopsis viridis]
MITLPIGCAVAAVVVLGFTAPASAAHLSTGDRIVNAAAAQAGKPYRSGGTGPGGFDCSGLAQYAHRQVGITLPRTASAQRATARSVSKTDKRPGDLVFFASGSKVYHVGIYAGNNKIWAAPESGDLVRLQTIWTSSYTVGRAW